ncbi:LANO_0B00342g1_1 [Lachancea nothofagi CBS 11611]|uniref:LANO_0B00342g1_1 n=1 Tax=Lachancea nothofagi CBS 11611 TaxID=1266666 RepID=A0A1G4IUI3_9SACH|nr:LANO_0B00342g1_1 [Lachancea nothofagi CBS 11611]
MPGKKMAKACMKCKQRKKKCSGALPCEYCVKINQPQDCEYQSRVKSKKAKVTERYISTLKSRIRELETERAKSSVDDRISSQEKVGASDVNPLIEPEYGFELHYKDEASSAKSKDGRSAIHYLGMSACAQFLIKLKESLSSPSGYPLAEHSSTATATALTPGDIPIDRHYIKSIRKEILPDVPDAEGLIDIASRIIGADYMFIESNYVENIVLTMIYKTPVPHDSKGLIKYTNELLRLLSHLALGSLFDKANPKSKSLGLKYHETTISLYGHIVNILDQAASGSLVQSLLYMAYFALSQDKTTFAFITVGSAIRTMFTLGFHKNAQSRSENRIFWLCFIYDRLLSVRFGFPLMIDENDINVPLFNEGDDSLTTISLDVYHFVSQVRLAKITTQIITKIYTQNPFSFLHNCHAVLKELKYWFDSLPNELKFDYDDIETGMIRATFNLHINYNYSIMISTRPVLLFVFRTILKASDKEAKLFEKRQFELILVLLESCIQAAEIQSRILTKLYYDGKMANCSFLDCHYIFSATIILILAGFCQMLSKKHVLYLGDVESLFEAIEHNLKILQGLSEYNAAARNFNHQLTEFIDLMSSEEVVGILKKDKSQKQNTSLLFQRKLTSPQPASLDKAPRSNEPIFDFEELGFVDLSHILNNMGDEVRSGSALDIFLNDAFQENSCEDLEREI